MKPLHTVLLIVPTLFLVFMVSLFLLARPRRIGRCIIRRRSLKPSAVTTLDHFYLCLETNQIYRMREELISKAKSSILLMTYRWRFRKDPSLFLTSFGNAFKRMASGVRLRILVNRTCWTESLTAMKNDFSRTLLYWSFMGVDLSKISIEVRTWNHWLLNNIHEKFLVVDHRSVLIRSSNIEDYSSGSEGTWREIGCAFQSPKIATVLTKRFENYWQQSEQLEVPISIVPTTHIRFTTHPPLPTLPPALCDTRVKSQLFFQDPLASPFASIYSSSSTCALFHTIGSAKHSIDIMSPNFNDLVLLSKLKEKAKDNVRIRIMFCYAFNDDAPWLQKFFLGYRTNKQMWNECLDDTPPLIECRYYSKTNDVTKPTIKKGNDVVHAKALVVDGETLVLGSVNMDVFSLLNSGELLFVLQSKDLGKQFQTFFNGLWSRGISPKHL